MDTDRLLRELNDFLRIPSISTSPTHDADCRAAAEWVAAELRRLGCDDVQFLASETHPVVWGVGPDVPGAPTLLVYGHYDVQPPDPLDEWTTPPFEPTVRGGKLFARGAADDKGQIFCLLKAIETNRTRTRPRINFRFLIEGEEEYGSRVLFELLRHEPERTRADAVLIADMAYIAPHWPAVYTTLRGLCYAELAAAVKRLAPKHVQTSVRFLHGADPATVAVTHPAFHLLDQAFKDVVGRGTVPARAGGSIPVVPALGKGGAPVILTGIGLPDDRLHAPNEKLDLKQLWDGIRVFGRFYELLASL